MDARMEAKFSGPRLSFAYPWAAKPNPMISRSGTSAHVAVDILVCTFGLALPSVAHRAAARNHRERRHREHRHRSHRLSVRARHGDLVADVLAEVHLRARQT